MLPPRTPVVSLEDRLLDALAAEDLLPDSEHDQALAVSGLVVAIENYKRHLDPEVALQRKELEALTNTLEDALAQLANLSPQSLVLYCKAANAPRGKGTSALRELHIIAKLAFDQALQLPNKVPYSSRDILAYQVAKVLRDALHIQPAATRDNIDFHAGARDGAAYARLLRKFCYSLSPPSSNGAVPIPSSTKDPQPFHPPSGRTQSSVFPLDAQLCSSRCG